MKKIKKDTIVRTIVLIIALTNQVLTVQGKCLLPISDEQVAETVSLVITIATSLTAWWKNNSFTQAAIEADELKETLIKKR